MSNVALVVTFKATEGRKDDLIAGLMGHAKRTLDNEEGCLRFDVLLPRDGAGDVMLYELYRDQAALDEHASSDRLAKWREESAPLVAERQIVIVDLQD
jgi:quinol monooxygenase YgiN